MSIENPLRWGELRDSRRGMRFILLSALVVAPAGSAQAAESVTGEFIAHVRGSDNYNARTKAFLAERWARRQNQEDADAFLLEALAVLSEEFRTGLALFEEQRYRACAEIMGAVSNDLDPYLAANAAVYEIKSLVAAEALEEAEARAGALLGPPGRVTEYTLSAAEVYYLKAYCELGNLKYTEASVSLAAFLQMFPEAPQRLRVTATQILAELRLRVPERFGDVTDLMDYAARRLDNGDSGDRVRQRQQQAVEILDKLIAEAQEREQSSGGGGASRGADRQGRRGANQASASGGPMQDSFAPPGRASPVTPEESDRRASARPGQAWGAMKPAERERIIQLLKDRFPDRYRRLVEQYYRELAKEP